MEMNISAIETLNQETVEDILEIVQMKENPSLGKRYTDVDVMIEELLNK